MVTTDEWNDIQRDLVTLTTLIFWLHYFLQKIENFLIEEHGAILKSVFLGQFRHYFNCSNLFFFPTYSLNYPC